MVEENDNLLKRIYYDPNHPAGFGGVNALARASGITLKDVEKWLKSESTYSLHKPARRRYSTRHYRISGINHLWQADLADMQPFAVCLFPVCSYRVTEYGCNTSFHCRMC